MANHILKIFTMIFFGLMLTAPSGLAQNGRRLPASNHVPGKPPSSIVVRPSQPSGSYTYTLFDFPGTFYTLAGSLNVGAMGKVQIVGGYGNTPLLATASFLLYGSENKGIVTETYQSVNVPGSPPQFAFGVNDKGQIVGEFLDTSDVYHGWELSGGTFTTIDVPFGGASGTGAQGINDSGEIVGGWDASGITQHGFTLIGKTFTSLDYPGAVQTFANAVNNKGDIVGYYALSDGVQHGFLLSGGSYTSIDPPGSVFTYAAGINDSGDIVGGYCTTTACVQGQGGGEGFLLSKGVYTSFTIASATDTGLQGINDKGLILGGYTDVAGYEHGFVALP